MINKDFFKSKLYRYIVYIICIVCLVLIYNSIINPKQIDFHVHVYNNGISSGDKKPFNLYSYNLFQLLLLFFHTLCRVPLKASAIIILVIFEVIRLLFVDHIIAQRKVNAFMPIFNCTLLFIMPIIELSTKKVYLGKGAGNIWHNTSYSALVPFALISLYYFKKCFIEENATRKDYIFMSIFMLLSLISKPNFIIAFLPSCCVFLIIKNKKIGAIFKSLFEGILVSIPCIIFLFIEFFSVYGSSSVDSNIIFSPFSVWSVYSHNILISLLLGLFFGLLYIYINERWADPSIEFLMILVLTGFLIYILFAESGSRFYDGNFGWTYNICGLLFQTYCAIEFYINYSFNNNRLVGILLWLVYSAHFFSGLIYLYQMSHHLLGALGV